MTRLLHTLLTVLWGLWFGGLVMLFIAVQSLFHTFATRHDVAGMAASDIFQQFNRLRLAVAAGALLFCFMLWLKGRSKATMWCFVFLGVAAGAAVLGTAILTPRIEQLRLAGQTFTTEFKHLHGESMATYLTETLLVLVAGLLMTPPEKKAVPVE